MYAFLAEHRPQRFLPELLLTWWSRAEPPVGAGAEVVATVTVLQPWRSWSDREVISALRRDIARKVACGLRQDDEGFHPTVLVY